MNSPQQLQMAPAEARPKRKLRPDVAARFASRTVQRELADLYAKPREELTPEELHKMKTAFLLGL